MQIMKNRQISLFDYNGKPNYNGSRDECVRFTIEARFTEMIGLDECCESEPKPYCRSCHEYFVECPVCKKRTKYYKHLYEAKQAWNRGEIKG